jgi:hypothetical protein
MVDLDTTYARLGGGMQNCTYVTGPAPLLESR